MANYNAVGELINGSSSVADLENGIIYGYSASGAIQWYNTVLDSNGTITRPGDQISLAFFQGSLYALWINSVFDMGISRWNGSSWVEVWSPPAEADGVAGTPALMALRDVVLVANVNMLDGASVLPPTVKYSNNGTTWQDGTVGGESDAALRIHAYGPVLESDSLYLHGTTAPVGAEDQTSDIWRWSGGNWGIIVADFGNMVQQYPHLVSASPDKNWRLNGAADPEYSDDFSTWTDSPNNPTYGVQRIFAIPAVNFAKSMGYFYNGVSAFDLVWNDGTAGWDDTPFGIWNPATYGLPLKLIRMNNGEIFMISPNLGGGGGNHVLKRTDTFPDDPVWPATIAQFYQGEGTLAFRFALPWAVVQHGGLALRSDGGVAIGSGVAAASTVIVTGPGSYSSFEDKTGDHPAEVIRRVVWMEG